MTPKEKAEELIDKYLNADFNCKDCDMPFCDMKCVRLHNYEAKQCALIAVDEILNNNSKIPGNVDGLHTNENSNYWLEVKQELEKL